jgi:hypothetical protein
VRLPSLRMSAPAAVKSYTGIDLGVEGQWDARVFSIAADTTGRIVTRVSGQTFDDNDIPWEETSSNPVLQLTRTSDGYARICQIIVHFVPADVG